jgi:hypothetical protein
LSTSICYNPLEIPNAHKNPKLGLESINKPNNKRDFGRILWKVPCSTILGLSAEHFSKVMLKRKKKETSGSKVGF